MNQEDITQDQDLELENSESDSKIIDALNQEDDDTLIDTIVDDV